MNRNKAVEAAKKLKVAMEEAQGAYRLLKEAGLDYVASDVKQDTHTLKSRVEWIQDMLS